MSDSSGSGASPHSTRFQKGKSGNPKGRPPRATSTEMASPMDIIVARKLTITQNGLQREVTLEEALEHKTYQQAIGGSRIAQRQILKMIEKREAKRAELRNHLPEKRLPLYGDDGRCDRVMQLLGIAHPDPKDYPSSNRPPRLLVEAWAVEIGLARPKVRQIPWDEWRSHLQSVHSSTRDAESIHWPVDLL